jgi:DNA-binding MarR family transcriptional regulator
MRTTSPPAQSAGSQRVAEAVLADLGRAVGSLRCAGSQRLMRLGISMTHFHVLTLLRHHDAMPMGHVAEILDTSMSSATGIIDRMVERGLVERVRVSDDRRVVMVQPTRTGLDLVDEVELVKSGVLAAALARMTTQSLDRMAAAAADLRAALDAELAGGPDRYAAFAQCSHAHGQPGRGQPTAEQPVLEYPTAEQPAPDEPVPAQAGASPITGPAGA